MKENIPLYKNKTKTLTTHINIFPSERKMSHTTKNINKCPKENKTIRVRKRKLKVRKGEITEHRVAELLIQQLLK